MDARDRYLAEVDAQLTLPDELKAEILEELAAHLADAVADLQATGREPAVAESEALARLGPPADLARALVAARRGWTKVLAAAGAGTWAAVTSGIRGAVAGWLVIVLASILGTVLARAPAQALGIEIGFGWTDGWNTVLTAAGLGVGSFLAGAAAVRAVARRSWRRPADVRSAVAVAGALAVGVLVLVQLEAALNWASVVALLLVPVAFVAGTSFESFRLPGISGIAVLLLAGLILILSVNVGSTAGGAGVPKSYWWSEEAHGYEMVGPWWRGSREGASADFPHGESGWGSSGIATVSADAASERVISQLRAFRLEAWIAQPPSDGWALIAGQQGPFATAPASVDGTTVSGTIRFDQVPGVDWAEVILTAIGSDGRRYLITANGPVPTEFHGSVWAWFSSLNRSATAGGDR